MSNLIESYLIYFTKSKPNDLTESESWTRSISILILTCNLLFNIGTEVRLIPKLSSDKEDLY